MKMFRDSSYPKIAGAAEAGAGAKKKKDMGDVAREARAEQSRRVGLPAPGAVDRAMEKGGKALAEGGSRLARKGMLGPVSKAPIVAKAVEAVKGVAQKGAKALSDFREENKRRGYDPTPTTPVSKAAYGVVHGFLSQGERARERDQQRDAAAQAASRTGKPRPMGSDNTRSETPNQRIVREEAKAAAERRNAERWDKTTRPANSIVTPSTPSSASRLVRKAMK